MIYIIIHKNIIFLFGFTELYYKMVFFIFHFISGTFFSLPNFKKLVIVIIHKQFLFFKTIYVWKKGEGARNPMLKEKKVNMEKHLYNGSLLI